MGRTRVRRIPVVSRLPTSWRGCRSSQAEAVGVADVTVDTVDA
jgi:hypothetical protein